MLGIEPEALDDFVRAARGQRRQRDRVKEPATPASVALFDPCTLHGKDVPRRRWIVEDWLPVGHVTVNYGDGGTGKTLLAHQLMTACALGVPWCGLEVRKCRSIGLFCEDDGDELHRRQRDILDHYGRGFDGLADMRWLSQVGADSALMTFDRDGNGDLTPLFLGLEELAVEFGAELVVVDTAADVFGGNENARREVRQFLGLALTRLARRIGGAVLLNAHPSRAGMRSDGDLDGGSTAWSNSVRSRWSLTRPIEEKDEGEVDTNERILTRRKANYAARGDQIRLRWQRGVLIAPNRSPVGPIEQAVRKDRAEEVFLLLLDRAAEQGQFVSAANNAPTYAPRMFAKRSDREGFTRKELEAAMNALFVAKCIRVGEHGRAGKLRSHIIREP